MSKLRTLLFFLAAIDCLMVHVPSRVFAQVLDIGSRRELFVDGYLIDTMQGVSQVLQKPVRREVVMTYDQPWEGNTCTGQSIFKDGDMYRMYYRAFNSPKLRPPTVGYAESTDGIHWTRPTLGIVEMEGSTANNLVFPLTEDLMDDGAINGGSGFMVFKDDNPACPAEERYKAVAHTHTPRTGPPWVSGLSLFVSPDGLHWSLKRDAIITDGEFDAFNRIAWDSVREQYVAFYREGTGPGQGGGYPANKWRAIKTATSPDALNWTPGTLLDYGSAPIEHLYEPAIVAYDRTPHIFIGLPMRFMHLRRDPDGTHEKEVTDVLFMTSRDGFTWRQWREAFLRPGPQTDSLEHYRWGGHANNEMAAAILETPSDVPGAPNELSIYSTEGYYKGKISGLRRHTVRQDGFVSIHAPAVNGELVTRPFTFEGESLSINFATSGAGSVWVELQDAQGQPLEGFTLADCPEIYGDAIDRVVTWKRGSDVSSLAGTPIRLRFVMNDADLYSIRFTPAKRLRSTDH